MFRTIPRPQCRTLLFVLLLSIAPLAQANEIKRLMRDMKSALQGAMASSTMAQFSGYVTRLEQDVSEASVQPYRDDPATYHEGMQTLQRQFAPVDQAIQADDLAAAKRALQKVNGTRKHYHDLLS